MLTLAGVQEQISFHIYNAFQMKFQNVPHLKEPIKKVKQVLTENQRFSATGCNIGKRICVNLSKQARNIQKFQILKKTC